MKRIELRWLTIVVGACLLAMNMASAGAREFVHPGALNNAHDLAFVRERLSSGEQPWAAAFEPVRALATPTTAAPRQIDSTKSSRDSEVARDAAQRTYANALAWAYTGNLLYAHQAVASLDRWSRLDGFVGGTDQDKLVAGWIGVPLAQAAEIMRGCACWAPVDVARMQEMFRRAFYPQLATASRWNGNVDLTQISALMSIAVFNDDAAMFEIGVARMRARAPAYFHLVTDTGVPLLGAVQSVDERWYHPAKWVDGLTQESCRDNNHHAQFGMASALQAAEVAWNQGIDIYGENRTRYVATMELLALQMRSRSMQGTCSNDRTSAELLDTWSIGYNHYHVRMGMVLPHTAALLSGPMQARGRSDWNIFHERLTHGSIPAPHRVQAAAVVTIEPRDAALARLIAPAAAAETLAGGFKWSEGPVWIPDAASPGGGYLLFSDVPANIAYRWDASAGVTAFLNPSGGQSGPELREPGTNGLIAAATAGAIIAADHGHRAIVQIDLASGMRTTLADRFAGKRLSSPNDVVLARSGDLYFTDPPYAFVRGDASPLKEQPVNGVYRRAPGGQVTLIDGSLARPNGIALSPDETRLYVANSDPGHAVWMVYDRAADGSISNGRILKDVTAHVGDANPGLPDGLKPDINGNLFATGPGGVYVLAADGREIGFIRVDGAVANVAFGGPARDTLYLTSGSRLIRLPTLTRGYQSGH